MTDTEKKLLQAQHRLEEAQARDRVKERKARTRRLIQEGAILTTDDNPDNEYMMYQSGINELVASARAIIEGHKINPDFQIGCMIAMVPLYAHSCDPNDFMEMTAANHKRYWFMDVHANGFVPNYIFKYWDRKGYKMAIDIVLVYTPSLAEIYNLTKAAI